MVFGRPARPGGEVLTFTDCAVVPEPTAEQLADIAIAAADARRRIVGDEPCVALLSFSTKGSAESPTVSRVREALALIRAREPGSWWTMAKSRRRSAGGKDCGAEAPGRRWPGRANDARVPEPRRRQHRIQAGAAAGRRRRARPDSAGARPTCSDLSRGASADAIFDVAAITALQSVARVARAHLAHGLRAVNTTEESDMSFTVKKHADVTILEVEGQR